VNSRKTKVFYYAWVNDLKIFRNKF